MTGIRMMILKMSKITKEYIIKKGVYFSDEILFQIFFPLSEA